MIDQENVKNLISRINFDKLAGLIPAIIQDYYTGTVLMLGFMNREALELTVNTETVHFFSRTKGRIWKKGESSGNTISVKAIADDCDSDTVLIRAIAAGPTCHTGETSCFNTAQSFIDDLSVTIKDRKSAPKEKSYTSDLFKSGIKRLAQKVGEEGVEVAIAALSEGNEKLIEESADLLFHLMVPLEQREITLPEVIKVLANRHQE